SASLIACRSRWPSVLPRHAIFIHVLLLAVTDPANARPLCQASLTMTTPEWASTCFLTRAIPPLNPRTLLPLSALQIVLLQSHLDDSPLLIRLHFRGLALANRQSASTRAFDPFCSKLLISHNTDSLAAKLNSTCLFYFVKYLICTVIII